MKDSHSPKERIFSFDGITQETKRLRLKSSSIGGKVEASPFAAGFSTTGTIDKIFKSQ